MHIMEGGCTRKTYRPTIGSDSWAMTTENDKWTIFLAASSSTPDVEWVYVGEYGGATHVHAATEAYQSLGGHRAVTRIFGSKKSDTIHESVSYLAVKDRRAVTGTFKKVEKVVAS